MDKYVGKRLDGRYELQELIGVGGMATVYKAYDTIDDKIVAVKILKEARQPSFHSRRTDRSYTLYAACKRGLS